MLRSTTNILPGLKRLSLRCFSTFPFGKHKGMQLSELPEDYVSWLIEKKVLDSNPGRIVCRKQLEQIFPNLFTVSKSDAELMEGAKDAIRYRALMFYNMDHIKECLRQSELSDEGDKKDLVNRVLDNGIYKDAVSPEYNEVFDCYLQWKEKSSFTSDAFYIKKANKKAYLEEKGIIARNVKADPKALEKLSSASKSKTNKPCFKNGAAMFFSTNYHTTKMFLNANGADGHQEVVNILAKLWGELPEERKNWFDKEAENCKAPSAQKYNIFRREKLQE